VCGIIGLFLKTPVLEDRLGALTAAMLHEMCSRGPDSAGFAVYGDVAAGTTKVCAVASNAGVDWSGIADRLPKALGAGVHNLEPEDLVALTIEAAAMAQVPLAGTDWIPGMRSKRDPGPRLDIDMYTEGHTVKDAKRLPLNLLDALRKLEGSSVLKSAFGEATVASYLKLRHAEWNEYCRHLTDWERQTTLDC
jgi:Glutamine synthetase, catalytic domain